ncbi:MAG: 4-carboxymuconolactone decarboxylase [Gammaproteobacteria bacterium]|nr:4-carboxymuconolactone decarboxylase [Gammaproteobacteria bacterium]MDD9895121.1 4-carboxymuconolactone decarboxylase [Gammaproteobacteria bacterium]MDD9959503.1 4-carboxymuconolactone decarboxylase [Gammaproteobacteria bacterium]
MAEEKPDKELFELGMQVRREVLGDDYVDAALAKATDLDDDFQRLITATAWGSVWGRDTLSRRDRSLITITQLASLGHHEELALHLRATINTGLSREDIKEALMQVGVYSGVPAANSAFRVAKQVFAELDEQAKS